MNRIQNLISRAPSTYLRKCVVFLSADVYKIICVCRSRLLLQSNRKKQNYSKKWSVRRMIFFECASETARRDRCLHTVIRILPRYLAVHESVVTMQW